MREINEQSVEFRKRKLEDAMLELQIAQEKAHNLALNLAEAQCPWEENDYVRTNYGVPSDNTSYRVKEVQPAKTDEGEPTWRLLVESETGRFTTWHSFRNTQSGHPWAEEPALPEPEGRKMDPETFAAMANGETVIRSAGLLAEILRTADGDELRQAYPYLGSTSVQALARQMQQEHEIRHLSFTPFKPVTVKAAPGHQAVEIAPVKNDAAVHERAIVVVNFPAGCFPEEVLIDTNRATAEAAAQSWDGDSETRICGGLLYVELSLHRQREENR